MAPNTKSNGIQHPSNEELKDEVKQQNGHVTATLPKPSESAIPVDLPEDGGEAEKKKKMGWIEYTWFRCQEMGVVKTIAWIFATMMYQVIGAWIYTSIEGEHNMVVRLEAFHKQADKLRNRSVWLEQFTDGVLEVQNYPSENHTWMLRQLVIGYEEAMGFTGTTDPIMKPEGWSWLNSIFFCCSLYTSIGFGGRLYPQSTIGRVVTMVYSFIGVPFFMSMTGDLGLVVFEGIYVLWWQVMSYLRSREEPDFDEDQIRGFRTSEYTELYNKIQATFPISLGILLSVISLAVSSGLAQFFEPQWNYFDANYYFVTSFLTIGLGDVSPSAPDGAPEWTLIPHIVLLIVSTTFIGLCQHVLSRRIECAYVNLHYAIHMEFRTRQVEPDISTMKSNQGPISEEAQIALTARKLGSAESFYYGMMDSSRRKLLHETWHKKANMKCVEIQTNLPKREVGCQHLMNVEEDLDTMTYGDDLGEEPPPAKRQDEPDLRAYVYKVVE